MKVIALLFVVSTVFARANTCADLLKSKSILVTGATGFVGRNLALDILQRNAYRKVIFVVRQPQKLIDQLKSDGYGTLPESVEIREAEAPEWDLKGIHADHVVHSAGLINGKDRAEYHEVNVDGTAALMDQVESAEKIIILSSMAAAGPTPEGKAARTEEDLSHPVTWYGDSKLEMEQRLLARPAHPGLWVLRPPMILGPRDSATLPLFKMAGGPVRIKVGSEKPLSFLAVDDLVSAIESILSNDVQPDTTFPFYFVSSPNVVSDQELIQTAGETMGRERDLYQVLNRWMGGNGDLYSVNEQTIRFLSNVVERFPRLRRAIPNLSAGRVEELLAHGWVVSSARFESAVGWEAKTDLRTSLEAAKQWYIDSGQLKRPRRQSR